MPRCGTATQRRIPRGATCRNPEPAFREVVHREKQLTQFTPLGRQAIAPFSVIDDHELAERFQPAVEYRRRQSSTARLQFTERQGSVTQLPEDAQGPALP